jgi:hypothetical protein
MGLSDSFMFDLENGHGDRVSRLTLRTSHKRPVCH